MNATQKDYLLRLFDIASAVMEEDYFRAEDLTNDLADDLWNMTNESEMCNCDNCAGDFSQLQAD